MNRFVALPVLAFRLARDLILSGWRTARVILRRTPPRSGFVRMSYPPMSNRGVVAYASLVALAPGSTFVSVDPVRREFVLHVLDLALALTIVTEMRRDYEGPLVALFGTEAP